MVLVAMTALLFCGAPTQAATQPTECEGALAALQTIPPEVLKRWEASGAPDAGPHRVSACLEEHGHHPKTLSRTRCKSESYEVAEGCPAEEMSSVVVRVTLSKTKHGFQYVLTRSGGEHSGAIGNSTDEPLLGHLMPVDKVWQAKLDETARVSVGVANMKKTGPARAKTASPDGGR